MNTRILESVFEYIKMNYLISSRDSSNFFINTLIIISITIIANIINNNELQNINVFISNLFYKIINISKTKNSFTWKGK